MTDLNFTLKPSKKQGSYKVDWDSEVMLNHIKVISTKGVFKLSKDHLQIILGIEEEIASRLESIHKDFDADTFVSSVKVSKERGKVFKCPTTINESIGKFCNLVLCLSRVKVTPQVTKLVWEVEELTNSLLTVPISDDESELESEGEQPSPTPDEVEAMLHALQLRKDEYKLYLMGLIDEVGCATVHSIDALEEKLVNGMKA